MHVRAYVHARAPPLAAAAAGRPAPAPVPVPVPVPGRARAWAWAWVRVRVRVRGPRAAGSGSGSGSGPGPGPGSLPGLVLFEPGVAGMGYSATRSAPAHPPTVACERIRTARQRLSENRPGGWTERLRRFGAL